MQRMVYALAETLESFWKWLDTCADKTLDWLNTYVEPRCRPQGERKKRE